MLLLLTSPVGTQIYVESNKIDIIAGAMDDGKYMGYTDLGNGVYVLEEPDTVMNKIRAAADEKEIFIQLNDRRGLPMYIRRSGLYALEQTKDGKAGLHFANDFVTTLHDFDDVKEALCFVTHDYTKAIY